MSNGKIFYSLDINQEIANYLKSKKREVQIKNMMLVNNEIFIFLKNSFILKFDLNGNLKEIEKSRDIDENLSYNDSDSEKASKNNSDEIKRQNNFKISEIKAKEKRRQLEKKKRKQRKRQRK